MLIRMAGAAMTASWGDRRAIRMSSDGPTGCSVPKRPGVARSSELVLGFRAGLTRLEGNPLVKPPDRNKCTLQAHQGMVLLCRANSTPRLRDVASAPGVQCVVHEGTTLQKPVVVGFHVEASHADGLESWPQRVSTAILAHVGRVNDLSQPHQRRIAAKLEVVNQDLKAALAVAVGELGTGGIEGASILPLHYVEHLLR